MHGDAALCATLRAAWRVGRVPVKQESHTHTHTQVSRGGIRKVASECCGAESTHSKLRLRLPGKAGLEFDFNLTQKHVLKVKKPQREV